MKKYFILISFILVACFAMAQERTVNSSKTTLENGTTYIKYQGVAADTLKETNQDTIDYVFNNYNHFEVSKISVLIEADSIAGNDSVYYSLTGYEFPDSPSGTYLASGGILINQKGELKPIVIESDSISFRKYVLRLIQDDNNDYDGGAEVQNIFWKLFLK